MVQSGHGKGEEEASIASMPSPCSGPEAGVLSPRYGTTRFSSTEAEMSGRKTLPSPHSLHAGLHQSLSDSNMSDTTGHRDTVLSLGVAPKQTHSTLKRKHSALRRSQDEKQMLYS